MFTQQSPPCPAILPPPLSPRTPCLGQILVEEWKKLPSRRSCRSQDRSQTVPGTSRAPSPLRRRHFFNSIEFTGQSPSCSREAGVRLNPDGSLAHPHGPVSSLWGSSSLPTCKGRAEGLLESHFSDALPPSPLSSHLAPPPSPRLPPSAPLLSSSILTELIPRVHHTERTRQKALSRGTL